MQKYCSKCKTEFTCKNEASGCWCEDIRLTSETLQQLKQQYDNCLCPACLAEYKAANVEMPASS